MGKKASGNAEFSASVTSSSSVSKVQGKITTFGIARGKKWKAYETVDPAYLDDILEDFNSKSSRGGGMALVLKRYADLPDFIATKAKCGAHNRIRSAKDNELIGKLADLAVWIKLTTD